MTEYAGSASDTKVASPKVAELLLLRHIMDEARGKLDDPLFTKYVPEPGAHERFKGLYHDGLLARVLGTPNPETYILTREALLLKPKDFDTMIENEENTLHTFRS